MCGIYGVLGGLNSSSSSVGAHKLSHRGPDDFGFYYDPINDLYLAHTRLAIIDLSNAANQPIFSDDNNYVLIFNGEIYNYQELRQELIQSGYSFRTSSDTEVVLQSFIHWGSDCLLRFRGMFAFCIYTKDKKELFLARDRFGIKPLIYSFNDDKFTFSSELKSFFPNSFSDPSPSICTSSLYEYLTFGSVIQPNTILEGIFHLPQSHYMIIDKNKNAYQYRYYDYAKESQSLPKYDTYEQAITAVRSTLTDATSYHMVSDVDVGIFLSGGVDSSAVLALANQCTESKLHTFSVGFSDSKSVFDETNLASQTAQFFSCNHHNILIDSDSVIHTFCRFIDSIDQPCFDGINNYIISEKASEFVKVALSGLGGDEIFGGYPHFSTISESISLAASFQNRILQKINHLRPNRFTKKYEYIGFSASEATAYQRSIYKDSNDVLKSRRSHFVSPTSSCTDLSLVQQISRPK